MSRNRERWTVAGLALLSVMLHLSRLDWGLPNWRRSTLAFGSKERIAELTPTLIRLREEIYAGYRDVNVDTMKDQPHAGERISERTLLNGMRSQLLHPRSTDEQQVIGGLSRLRQGLKDWKLPFIVYGYAYLALVGLAL